MVRYTAIMVLHCSWSLLVGQEQPLWDNTDAHGWPQFCQQAAIPSSLDGAVQPAYVRWSESEEPRPLVVSLHTWSGDYTQQDTLAWICSQKDYHYIHPDFRGANNHPEACGSSLAIGDIEDAITYALEHASVDTGSIHLVGTSGGGYAVLLAYMKTGHPVATFSAWVPISDLEKWYHESRGRGNKYAEDILKCTSAEAWQTGAAASLNVEEARRRSPLHMYTPTDLRSGSKLMLYTGIHDGYIGSVPVTQTLEFYNKVVSDFDPQAGKVLVSKNEMLELVASRSFSGCCKRELAGRTVHFEKRFRDRARVLVFEGGHEMLTDVALDQVEPRRILLIGDSNGAARKGWAEQLKTIRFRDHILNASVPGNTIGFDNLGDPRLNTLRNVDRYMETAMDSLGGVDDVVILLGTNDCKRVFSDSLSEVPRNLEKLIRKIREYSEATIYVVSPPPAGEDEVMLEKYHGSAGRVAWLQPRFREVARTMGCIFVDCYEALLSDWEKINLDGIHLNEEGQWIIAAAVDKMQTRY